jgi:glycosyltransferase involved in cell wall biosynthesis
MSRRPASNERSASAGRPLRLLWLGSYESDYPRNRVLISGLRQLGVEVIECHAPIWERQRHKAGAFLRPGNLIATAGDLLRSWVRLGRAQARLEGVDAVVIGYPSQPDVLFGWAVARRRRVPLVVDAMISMSDAFSDRGVGGVGARGLAGADRLTLGRAEVVIADTDANREYLRMRFGLPDPRVATVPVGADPTVFPPAPPPRHAGHALFVGKLAPLHGVDVVLEAARMAGTPPVRIIGSGQLDGWLADELERDPPSGVSHVPWVPFAQLGDEIRAASICLGVFSPSERVGRVVPNKVWQAMAVGRPIITADGPAPREVLEDERSALLVPPGDAGALADALRRLGEDADLRRELSAAARRRYVEVGAPARVAERFLIGIGQGPNVPV